MTKEEIMNQVEEMLPDAVEHIKRKCNQYLLSGMINIDYYEDTPYTYYISKTMLCAALYDTAEQYHFNQMDKDLKNLKRV